jgi:hypothetical protein
MFSEFSEVMDIPDLHQKAQRAESNSGSTSVAAVDPSVSGRSGMYNCRHDMIKDLVLLGGDTGLLGKLFPVFQRKILP